MPARARGTVEWYSPRWLVARARAVLGGIDLDPATCPRAQRVVGARYFYTKANSGLRHRWSGRVYINPPYRAPLLALFVRKLLEEHAAGRVPQALVLVPNATETPWCQALLERAAVCWLNRRVSFWYRHPGAPISGNVRGSLLAYLGPHTNRFVEVCGDLGVITPPGSSWADREVA